MKDCEHFTLSLDEWVAGTLPDFERHGMERHAAGCAPCAELAADARAILGAARVQPLRLPDRIAFAAMAARAEMALVCSGSLGNGTHPPPMPRAKLLSSTQALAVAVGIGVAIAVLIPFATWSAASSALAKASSVDVWGSQVMGMGPPRPSICNLGRSVVERDPR